MTATDVHILVICGSKLAVGWLPRGTVAAGSHLVSKGECIIIQKGRRADGCGGRLRIWSGGRWVGERDLLHMRRRRPGWPL